MESQSQEMPANVGPYQRIEPLGEGGMGVVYRARQTQPVDREVALKLVKAGMDTKQVLARFEAERQALAVMDHPNIAKVFDGGETESGRPYFVMELVHGESLTDYCSTRKLPLRAQLELFIAVCRGIQHAHLKGIVHRDLKPTNILIVEIDGKPVPKVIDFGIAKAIETPLTEATLVTNYAQMMGTPAYMSPEQADLSGVDVDTRTDIYALGVLLYELLTGSLPIDKETLESAAFAEVQRLLWEEDPPKPSKRLTSLGETRMIDEVQGDLDCIVMKAMDKDRTRRYETAASFAEDLTRHLEHEPVLATPPSKAYIVCKFIQRHRAGVLAGAAFVALLVAATLVSAWLAIRASQAEQREYAERQRAETQASIAEETLSFFEDDVFKQANPQREPDRDIKLRTVLDKAARKLEGRFQDQPRVRASLLRTLGMTYGTLGELEKSLAFKAEALALLRGDGDDTSPLFLRLLRDEALLPQNDRNFAQTIKNLDRILEQQVAVLGENHLVVAETHSLLGTACNSQGYSRRALESFDRAIALYEALGMPNTARDILSDKAIALTEGGQFDDALAILQKLSQEYEDEGTLGHYPGWLCLQSIGRLHFQRREIGKAEAALKQALAIGETLMGKDNAKHLAGLRNLGVLASARKDFESAHANFKDCYERALRVYGPENGATMMHHEDVAKSLEDMGRHEESLKEWFALMRLRLRLSHHSHEQAERGYEAMKRQLGNLNQLPRLAAFDDEIAGKEAWPSDRTLEIVPKGTTWRWIADAPPKDWFQPETDDTSWQSGKAPFGYGEPEIQSKLSGRPATHYFRLTLPRITTSFEKVRIGLRADDAFALYVNGKELSRRNLPEPSATDHTTRSLHKVGGFEERFYYYIDVDPQDLQREKNVLAVELHQHSASSSDLFFDLFAEGLKKVEETR